MAANEEQQQPNNAAGSASDLPLVEPLPAVIAAPVDGAALPNDLQHADDGAAGYSDDDDDAAQPEVELPATREITQTDVLNVHMLRAFSNFLDANGAPVPIPPAPEHDEADDSQWDE